MKGDTWSQTKKRYQRKSQDCSAKSRRLVELISGGLKGLLEDIRLATSATLKKKQITLVDAEERSKLWFFEHALKDSIVSTIEQKTGYLLHPPYTLLTALSCDKAFGDLSTVAAKRLLQAALDEVDGFVMDGQVKQLHRVTVRLAVGAENPFAVSLRRFANGEDEALASDVKWELVQYAGASLVSRRVEASHSHVKSHQRHATHSTPALINARLRSENIAKELTNNPKFFNFRVSNWRKHTTRARLLMFAFPRKDRWKVFTMPKKEFNKWLSPSLSTTGPPNNSLTQFNTGWPYMGGWGGVGQGHVCKAEARLGGLC